MSAEIDIRIQNLSKVYRIYEKPEHRLIQMATLGRIRRFTEFAALRDVSLEIRHGETVGILGRNGSGKSTLLQIICGTLQSTSGSVEVQGRVAALLELGAGFNGEFTGRENVYMNGAILGFSREEMDARFEAIAEFAGIGDFIERPVKIYSTGMFVRLAFAVATAVEPDILVVDEALSVGDEAFQRKCFARIEAIKERGGTILFVSHGAQTIVQLCDRAVLLDAGEKLLEGNPKAVVAQYQRLVNLSGEQAVTVRREIAELGESGPIAAPRIQPEHSDALGPGAETKCAIQVRTEELHNEWYDPNVVSPSQVEFDSQGAHIEDVRILTLDGRVVNNLYSGRKYLYCYRVRFNEDREQVGFGMSIRNAIGLDLAGGTSTLDTAKRIPCVKGGSIQDIMFIWRCELNPGTYFVNAGTSAIMNDDRRFSHRILDACAFRVMPHDNLISNGWFNVVESITITEVAP